MTGLCPELSCCPGLESSYLSPSSVLELLNCICHVSYPLYALLLFTLGIPPHPTTMVVCWQ